MFHIIHGESVSLMQQVAYSCLRASMGFRLEAFFAGKYPKKIPTKAANRNETIIDGSEKING